jgi:hypothetical protein
MMMTMIDNDNVFLNLNNYPNPTAAFNNIMRQHYDSGGNPIQRQLQQTNENREILSSVQSTNTGTRTKKDALTLDLLLTNRPYYEGWNWRQICSDVDDLISEPCSDLVTSDGNALTAEGKATLERIGCQGKTLLAVLLTKNPLAPLEGLRC